MGPVSIILNTRLVQRAEGLQTALEERDVIAFIVLAAGG
jgi:molybdopterin converting factor small subunit